MKNSFKAITWNVYAGTKVSELTPILHAQLNKGVSVGLMQEAGGVDITSMLKDAGLRTFVKGQYRLFWDPEAWVDVNTGLVRLSDTNWYAKGGDTPRYSEAAWGILCDKYGRSLEVMSYHTPAHIQVPEDERPERRLQATLESFGKMGRMAEKSQARGFLAGGDDNVDEFRGIGSDTGLWKPMLVEATGLRQIQAPKATHGRVRKIDDFRIPRGGGLRYEEDEGWVADGGGDHKLHGRKFYWR